MKLEQDITAYLYSTLENRQEIIIRAGEYNIIKRETNSIGEEKVWLEHTTKDKTVMTSAPLVSKTHFGRTPLGIALDGDVVYRCVICGRGHSSNRAKTGDYPSTPSSIATHIGDNKKAVLICLDPKLCRR